MLTLPRTITRLGARPLARANAVPPPPRAFSAAARTRHHGGGVGRRFPGPRRALGGTAAAAASPVTAGTSLSPFLCCGSAGVTASRASSTASASGSGS
ncbi:hypothetical protein V500_05350, partial [Pseudogymnoascus sp. VKM F-4518 (FW-2643)]